MRCRAQKAEHVIDLPVVEQRSILSKTLSPTCKIGHAMLHMSLEQLCLLMQHPPHGPAIDELLELLTKHVFGRTRETAVCTFVTLIENKAPGGSEQDLQEIRIILAQPDRI